MVPAFKKCVFYLIALVATLTGGCCYPADRLFHFRIDGIVKDGSGNSIQNEKIVVTVPFIVHEEEIVSLTDQEGQFSCDAYNAEGFAFCLIPPTFLFIPGIEPHFNISIPNRSRYDYKIDFPGKNSGAKRLRNCPPIRIQILGTKR